MTSKKTSIRDGRNWTNDRVWIDIFPQNILLGTIGNACPKVAIPKIDFMGFVTDWLDMEGYDITKREPELLPCPVCGREAEYYNNDKRTWCVSSILCAECAKVFLSYPTFIDAVEAWNTLPRKEGR